MNEPQIENYMVLEDYLGARREWQAQRKAEKIKAFILLVGMVIVASVLTALVTNLLLRI